MSIIRPLDTERLHAEFTSADPFPFIAIEEFLDPDFARAVAASYPDFDEATQRGRMFQALNENLKVQTTDPDLFPDPVKQLSDALASDAFREDVSKITGIPKLRWDATFNGGGMHQTASSGLLDVHVDFNVLEDQGLFRRLNLLIYLNEEWEEAWGGHVELWNRDVSKCMHSFRPKLNRAVLFETSEHSWHGVRPVRCPAGMQRKSFAIYLYTEEAPASYVGKSHTTMFRARPDEHYKRLVAMPAAAVQHHIRQGIRGVKNRVKRLVGRA